jgi:UDP-glucose 4-epimerase
MKILITGVSGFIGQALAASLSLKHEVVGIGRRRLQDNNGSYHQIDVFNRQGIESLFKENNFDVVVHLAALTGHADIIDNKFEALNLNISGTINLLSLFAKYCKNGLFLFSSTGKVYGKTNELPITEAAFTCPTNVLGKSKLITEDVVKFFSDYDINNNQYCCARIFNVYGPKQAANFIVPTLLALMKQGSVLQLGNTKDRRDYLYIDDLITALSTIIEQRGHLGTMEILNIASGVPTSVEDIINVFSLLNQTSYDIVVDQNKLRYDETPDEYACIDKMRMLFGWRPLHNLEAGITKVWEAEQT